MTDAQRLATVAGAERWFEANGLPYFVSANEQRVRDALAWRRLLPVILGALILAGGAGTAVGLTGNDVSAGVLVGALVAVAVVGVYAVASLHLGPIVRWAVRKTFGSLGSLFPLITRALPLLLLFMTFLFINTEVWQVCAALDRGLLWLCVMLFAAVAVVFLLVRLPEEVNDVRRDARGPRLVAICADTPVAEAAEQLPADTPQQELSSIQRANLVLVLLFSQALQVLLLASSVFVFFLCFGKIAITSVVMQAWVGETYDGHPIPSPLPSLSWLPISNELFQVSVFLAAFSGLYFTVYAVTDENYRRQFFTSVAQDVERAVGVETVYRALASLNPSA